MHKIEQLECNYKTGYTIFEIHIPYHQRWLEAVCELTGITLHIGHRRIVSQKQISEESIENYHISRDVLEWSLTPIEMELYNILCADAPKSGRTSFLLILQRVFAKDYGSSLCEFIASYIPDFLNYIEVKP